MTQRHRSMDSKGSESVRLVCDFHGYIVSILRASHFYVRVMDVGKKSEKKTKKKGKKNKSLGHLKQRLRPPSSWWAHDCSLLHLKSVLIHDCYLPQDNMDVSYQPTQSQLDLHTGRQSRVAEIRDDFVV
jgi:hypothetical protein